MNGSTLLQRGFSKKFQEPDGRKLDMPKMFYDLVPSTKNLKATDGVRPREPACKLFDSESLMITESEPEPRIPV